MAFFSGDDSKIYCNFHTNLFKIDSIIKDHTIMKSDSVVESLSPHRPNFNKDDFSVVFLKRYVTQQGISGWDMESVIKKLLYNSEGVLSPYQTLNWVESNFYSAPGNSKLCYILYKYCIWLAKNCGNYFKKDKQSFKTYLRSVNSRLKTAYNKGVLHQHYNEKLNFMDSDEKTSILNFFEINKRTHILKLIKTDLATVNRDFKALALAQLLSPDKFSRVAFKGLYTSIHEYLKDMKYIHISKFINKFYLNKYKLDQVLASICLFSKDRFVDDKLKDMWYGVIDEEVLNFFKDVYRQDARLKKIFPNYKRVGLLNKVFEDTIKLLDPAEVN